MVRAVTDRAGGDVLLERSALISELADFGEQDTHLARQGLAEVVYVSGRE